MSKEIENHIQEIFQIKSFLGSGAYGHVWKVAHRQTQREYALKKIFDAFQNDVDAQRTYREVSILHQLDHDNIIKLCWVIRAHNNRDLYLVFEFMETDLHSILGENLLGTTHLRFIAYQLCKVLKYLHSAQLIHRDLKSSNVLVNSNCQIKICDFGLVRSLIREEESSLVLSQDVATRWYRSPEMLLGSQNYGKSTDMWSMGCILAELVIGQPLLAGSSTLQQIQKIVQFTGIPNKNDLESLQAQNADAIIQQLKIKKKSFKSYFGQCDSQIKELILKLLDFNPKRRITAEQALSLPFMQQFRGKTAQNTCHKFIVSQIDDNIRLSLQQYRRLIYKDIQRRYPAYNKISPMPRIYRAHHSLKSRNNNDGLKRMASNSLFKLQKHKTMHNKTVQNSFIGEQHPVNRMYKKQLKKIQQFKQQKQNITQIDKPALQHQRSTKVFKRRLRGNLWGKQELSNA